ncbi:MAG: hypothetical protein FJ295_16745 [Planctomycetes bacterium]|nr:hypothetical protein [Planctomycetota bacterium]
MSSSQNSRRFDRAAVLIVFALCGTPFGAASVLAQQRGVTVVALPVDERTRAADQEEEEAERAQRNPANGHFEIAMENFDIWVYGQQGGGQGFAQRLDALLRLRIEEIDRVCGLSELQKKKLLLAGKGDLKRFNDRVDELRVKFEKVRFDQEKFNNIWQEIGPVQTQVQQGLFGRGSFFQKAVRPALKPEQLEKYDGVEGRRMAYRYKARVELWIASTENTVPLTAEQREKLRALILSETTPPAAFGQYDTYFVAYAVSKIDEKKLEPLFDETQWKVLKIIINQGRGMEQFLKQNGMIDGDFEPPVTPGITQ